LALATNGFVQAGYASAGGGAFHAFAWTGSAASAVDLSQLLPSGFLQATAYSVDSHGDVFGLASDASGRYHAVEWVSVPEPSAGAVIALLALSGIRNRKLRV